MSFEEVYKKYYNELRLFGRRFDMPTENCADLLQETFLRYYLELKKGTEFGNSRAWLYKVFLNQIRNCLSSEKNKTLQAEMITQNEEIKGSVHDDYTVQEKQRIVMDAMNCLDERDKEILLLYHQGFSYNEIAGITGTNPGSMGKTISRAIEKLKNSLKLRYNEMFDKD
jgi:RNA polymerase sigma-70 factor (ECF subfamily)